MRPLVILTALALATPARAFDYKVELGGFLGAHIFSGTNGLGRYPGDGDGNALSHGANFGMRLSFAVHKHVILEGELALIPTVTHGGDLVLAFGWRGHVVFDILTGKWRPFVLVGGGGFTSSSSNPLAIASDTDGEIHAGVGLKWDVRPGWGVRVDGRIQFSPAIAGIYFTEDFEVTAGFYGVFSGKIAPPPPPPAPTPPRPAVEPKPAPPPVEKDSDGDGVVDKLDKCPTEKGIPENQGCPDKDTDGDGIVDRLDKCPAEKGIPENQGCPDKDTDSDGIVDRLDKCPEQPETKNGFKDADGCPDEYPDDLKAILGVVEIGFARQATFLASSYPVFERIASVMKQYPEVVLEVVVHTDDAGPREKNLALSVARAEAIVAQLVGKGIARERLRPVGAGPDKPLSDGKSAEAKAKNRRVEIRVVVPEK